MGDPVPGAVRRLVEFAGIDHGCEYLDCETQFAGLDQIDQIGIRYFPLGNEFFKGEMALDETQHGRPVKYFVHDMF